MNFLTWGRNPWGQTVLTHVSWDLMWASLFAGLMFLAAHASYMILSAHRKRSPAETDALEALHKNLPAKIERHSFMARMFHWVMSVTMFVLLFTAFGVPKEVAVTISLVLFSLPGVLDIAPFKGCLTRVM